MTNYSDKIFVEQLRTTKYSDYPSYYQKFVRRFLPIINFVVLIRTLGVKFNTKPWFDIDILNVIRNGSKHYKKYKRSSKKIDKDNSKCAKLLIQK